MDSNNAVNSTQLSEQMNTAIPNVVHASISADPARPTDIPELCYGNGFKSESFRYNSGQPNRLRLGKPNIWQP